MKKENCEKETSKWDNKFVHQRCTSGSLLKSADVFIWNSLYLKILYERQNYWQYLGFKNIFILTTFDQVISLNWKYYPEQCPIPLSTVYWDNGAGCNINDIRVQSHVSFILLEFCARCIVPLWCINVERGKELLSLEMVFMG